MKSFLENPDFALDPLENFAIVKGRNLKVIFETFLQILQREDVLIQNFESFMKVSPGYEVPLNEIRGLEDEIGHLVDF